MRKIILTLFALALAVTIFSACGKAPIVEIKNETLGDISIVPAKGDKVVYPDENGKLDIYGSHHINIQSALIQNEKFDMVLGYTSYKDETDRNTYEKNKQLRYIINEEDVTFDGLTGYTYTESGVHYLFFPAKTKDAARVVAIYSLSTVGVAEGSRMSGDAARELAKTEEVQKILKTLKF